MSGSVSGHSATHVGQSLGFEGDVHRSGYLVKRAKKSGANWKKRYFVLNGSSLIYYESHTKLNTAKGNVLVTVDFVVRDVQEPKYPCVVACFVLCHLRRTIRATTVWSGRIRGRPVVPYRGTGPAPGWRAQSVWVNPSVARTGGAEACRRVVVANVEERALLTQTKSATAQALLRDRVGVRDVAGGGGIGRGGATVEGCAEFGGVSARWDNAWFLQLKTKSRLGTVSWVKKFFVVHSNAVTWHADHFATHKNQGSIKIGARTTLDTGKHEIVTVRTGSQELSFQCRDATETKVWVDALTEAVKNSQSRDDLADKVGKENNEEVLLDGFLGTADEAIINQPDTRATGGARRSSLATRGSLQAAGAKIWPEFFYALTPTALYQAKTAECTEATGVFLMSPTCAVFETTLRPFSFELVTPQGVLHVHAQSDADREKWTKELRAAIRQSTRLVSDPLIDAAKHIPLDTYDLVFERKQPLGIVLERSAEWALVKSCKTVATPSSNAEGGSPLATPGSALAAVNGDGCLLKPYADVIKSLTGWQPPLTLTFARAPVIKGFLSKRARGRSGRNGRGNWKKRYVEVAEGKLAYYDKDVSNASDQDRDAAVRGALFLMGCAVALAPKGPETDDQPFCFRLVSGIGVIVFQAETLDDVLRWATTLYHGIAIANGGGYILEMERLKLGTDQPAPPSSEPPAPLHTEEPPPETTQDDQDDEEPEQPEPVAQAPEPEPEPVTEVAEPEAPDPVAEVAEPESPESEDAPAEEVEAAETPPAEEEPAPPADTTSSKLFGAVAAEEEEETLPEPPPKPAVDRRFSSMISNQEAVLPSADKPHAAALVVAHDDDDEDEDDDDRDSIRPSDVVVAGAKIAASTSPPPPPPKSAEEEIAELIEAGVAVLTDDELQNTFTLLSNDKEWLNPMQFISLLRSVGLSDDGNLKFELDLFHQFDIRKEGHITKEEFVAGMHKHMSKSELESNATMRNIVLGIRKFQHQGTVEL